MHFAFWLRLVLTILWIIQLCSILVLLYIDEMDKFRTILVVVMLGFMFGSINVFDMVNNDIILSKLFHVILMWKSPNKDKINFIISNFITRSYFFSVVWIIFLIMF